MHCINQHTKVLGIHRLVDAVTEVEDVPAVIAETRDDVLCFFTDGIGICIEYAGVEVALQCDAIADAADGLRRCR